MFDSKFIFGAATASYQIEGAVSEDGRGVSIWDTFSHTKGKVAHNQNGDEACDHYHRIDSDVELMKQIGIKSYRFSIAWPRIIPNGVGNINQAGIDFYNRLINKLIENDITPFITLYHWDLPQTLQDIGGWLNPSISDWFENYARVCAKAFGDRVKFFTTFNEPQIFSEHGYITGAHAPGLKLSKDDYLRICHNILLSNGKATRAIKSEYADIKVGMAVSSPSFIPVSKEAEAYADKYFAHIESIDAVPNSRHIALWLDPVFFGHYPKVIEDYAKQHLPEILDDLDMIKVPQDFIGANNYQGTYFDVYPDGSYKHVPRSPGACVNHLGWLITPETLYWCVREMCNRYHCDMYICENGLCLSETPSVDGFVHDPQRIDYLQRHLDGLEKAYDEGYPIKGYFAWSLMDNFEWASGYEPRFGIIYVDFNTKQRILKDSAKWYSKYIKTKYQ